MPSSFVRGLKCRLCGKEYPLKALNFCTEDFGPVEVFYDYDALKGEVSRPLFERRLREPIRADDRRLFAQTRVFALPQPDRLVTFGIFVALVTAAVSVSATGRPNYRSQT